MLPGWFHESVDKTVLSDGSDSKTPLPVSFPSLLFFLRDCAALPLRLMMGQTKTWESVALLPFVILIPLFSKAWADCFYPNGDLSFAIPCNSSAAFSTCCTVGSTCLSNGVCRWTNAYGIFIYVTDSCTDKAWASRDCPPMSCSQG